MDNRTPKNLLSVVAQSNDFTKGCAVERDKRQTVPDYYYLPGEDVRIFLARLIVEEVIETVTQGLGLNLVVTTAKGHLQIKGLFPKEEIHCVQILGPSDPGHDGVIPNFEEAIDGACDSIYVLVGMLRAMGAPDLPHLAEVCRANDSKFPGGKAIVDAHGKYQKPEGWQPPDHKKVMVEVDSARLANVQSRNFDSSAPHEDKADPDNTELAMKAFEAWQFQHTGQKAHVDQWRFMPAKMKAAWIAAVDEVLNLKGVNE